MTDIELLGVLSRLQINEKKAEDGKAFAYTYTTKKDMDVVSKRISEAYRSFSDVHPSDLQDDNRRDILWKSWELFMHTNALNPTMYPSLRRMENEVVRLVVH